MSTKLIDTGEGTEHGQWLEDISHGQSFTLAATTTLESIKVYVDLWPEDSVTVTANLYAGTVGHLPTGAVLATGTLDSGDLTPELMQWATITFVTPAEVAAGVYVIVLSQTTPDSGYGVYWDASTPSSYADGRMSSNAGGTWTARADYDYSLEVWGTVSDAVVSLTGDTTKKRLVAVGSNEVWYEDIAVGAGEWVELDTSSGAIDTSDQLNMFEAYGKVFVVNGANLKVADFQNTKIATANIGTYPPDRGNILTAAGGAKMVVDYITAVTGACTIYGYRITEATFSTEAVTGTDDNENAISFTTSGAETAPPHWYDWTVYGNDTTTYGSMPAKAYIGCLSGGRCILSGNPSYPHQAPTSASGNPWDWNIYRTTADRATVIGSGTAGQIGDVVRALIPARDGQLIIGCANSLHIMVDNPAYGGQMVDIVGTGIFDATSWCFDGDGNLYFWGTGGIYKLAKGAAGLENITATALPNLISDTGADPSTYRITMGFDGVRQGVKVCITLLADGTSANYWLDLKTGGLFPDTHATAHGVYSQFQYDANSPTYKGLLLGCKDGYVRWHADSEENDDGTAIDSYVTFGPLPLAEDGRDGSLEAFDMVLAGGATGSLTDSNAATVEVWTEDVAETLLEKLNAGTSPKLSMTFAGPGRARGAKRRRGVRGAYAGIKVGNSTIAETWGMEKILLDSGSPGRRLR